MKMKSLIIILGVVGAILLIPFIAMQFTSEVDWSLFDFILMGVLLTGTGLLIDLAIRKIKTNPQRLIVLGVILLTFFLIWAELAVGIFGSPFAGS
ncbi:hypothetical protein [Pedobacter glucosidilyticus]|uniref:hypothetical protein n=1 Tax=Pedobacter glucosidilyticus TaxID=1122941 RepID=UPI0004798519|nr:hypothetical protein [Pedobacter glucosidilyticus]